MNTLYKAERITAIGTTVPSRTTGFPFYFVLLYLVWEYGRPQASIPGLAHLHIPAVVMIVLVAALLFSGATTLLDRQTKLFIFLLAFMGFHVPIALNSFWALQTLKAMVLDFVVYLSIITFVDTFDKFKKLITIWLGIHVYLAITGIVNAGMGVGGFLGDDNDLSLTLTMIVPYAISKALSEPVRHKKVMYFGLTLLFLLANISTLSRGGFVGLVAVGTYWWVRSPKKIVSMVLITLLAGFMYFCATERYWGEMRSIEEEGTKQGGTGEERLYFWEIAGAMFLDNAIIGVGQGNVPFRFRQYEEASGYPDGLRGRSRAGHPVHSIYFTMLPELGLLGTLVILGMLYCIFRDAHLIRQLRSQERMNVSDKTDTISSLSRGMEASLIGFLSAGAFLSVLYYPHLWVLMGFIVALKKITHHSHENNLASH